MKVRDRISASVADIRARGQKLVQLHIELLKTELKQKAQEYGGAVGMLVAGALLALYALGFALTTITVVLALVLPLWLALLIITLVLLLIVAILFMAGRKKLQQLQAADPGQAGPEAKATAVAAKDAARRTAKSLRPGRVSAPEAPPTDGPPVEAPLPVRFKTASSTASAPEVVAPQAESTEAGT